MEWDRRRVDSRGLHVYFIRLLRVAGPMLGPDGDKTSFGIFRTRCLHRIAGGAYLKPVLFFDHVGLRTVNDGCE
jgi:hypothetical protein